MPSPNLARLPNVIATPHVGGLVPQAIAHQALETTRQVAEIVQGRAPPGAVNPEHASRLARLREANAHRSPDRTGRPPPRIP
jgi:D-3-phosphoglycerate dehydrogenase